MNESTPTVSKGLAKIFRDWAKQCEALARPLPKSSLAREMLCQAAQLLAILGDAESPDHELFLEKPATTRSMLAWVSQWMNDWPAPGKCPVELAAEVDLVQAFGERY